MNQIIWHGPVFGQSGYEVITREILIALDKIGVRVRLDLPERWNAEKIVLPWEIESRLDRMINTSVIPGTPIIMHQQIQPIVDQLIDGTKKYCYTLFETDRLPEPWKEGLLKMDGIFTFSNFNKDCWTKDGLDNNKIHVLPYGVSKEFTNGCGKANILNKKGFTFIANGDFVERKNFEALIEAYTTEFKANENVTLVLKTHYGGFVRSHRNNLLNTLKSLAKKWNTKPPRILFYGDKISVDDMASLYRACDCLVMPSRGEGLGLPILEAMACGLSIIATNWSAIHEIDFEGIKVTANIETIDNIEFIKKCPHALNHKWANIDVKELKKSIRWMFENQEESKSMGKLNAEKIKYKTWHDAAINIIRVISEKEGKL